MSGTKAIKIFQYSRLIEKRNSTGAIYGNHIGIGSDDEQIMCMNCTRKNCNGVIDTCKKVRKKVMYSEQFAIKQRIEELQKYADEHPESIEGDVAKIRIDECERIERMLLEIVNNGNKRNKNNV